MARSSWYYEPLRTESEENLRRMLQIETCTGSARYTIKNGLFTRSFCSCLNIGDVTYVADCWTRKNGVRSPYRGSTQIKLIQLGLRDLDAGKVTYG